MIPFDLSEVFRFVFHATMVTALAGAMLIFWGMVVYGIVELIRWAFS